MGILEDLVGNLATISDEELESMVQTGRLGREEEAEAARSKTRKAGGGGRKTVMDSLPPIDLDDFD